MEKQIQIAMEVSQKSLAVNVILSAIKFVAGVVANSGAMISDAIHSASDVFSTIIVMIGVKLSAKAEDKEHPYGHERLECVAAIILAMLLLLTGIFIGYESVQKILSAETEELAVPGTLAIAAAVISIIVKEMMFWYTRHFARLIHSEALMADAWHHHSDALSSVGALIGIVGARMGLPVLDPVAGLFICFFIAKAAFDIFREAIEKMVDHTGDIALENALREKILSYGEIHSIDLMKTREFGNRIYVELEISVNGQLPLLEAHEIAENLHDDIEKNFPSVKHIMIHLNPC
ncbi:MAG: cation transporter [Selenomonadaceae bacterium]|nr:cation transporter [Selenomonadaceae bacterium]